MGTRRWKCGIRLLVAGLVGVAMASPGLTQHLPDPGFKSVGRGAPVLVPLPTPDFRIGGGAPRLSPEQLAERQAELSKYPFVGTIGAPPGAPPARGMFGVTAASAWNGAT